MIFPFFRRNNSAIASPGSSASLVKCTCNATRSSSASAFEIATFRFGCFFCISLMNLNKAVGPIDHFRIVLPIGKIDVFTSGFGWFLLVNCKVVEFGYEPFVVSQYAARRHSDLLQLSLNFCG